MREQLKPCPFCDGEALYRHLDDKWAVRCRYCNVQTFGYATQEEAIKSWNTRKPMEQIAEQMKAGGK